MITAELYKPIEVTARQYATMIYMFAGIVAHRKDLKRGKFWIKRLCPDYRKEVEQFLNQIN